MNYSLSIAARDSGFLIELQGSDGSLVAERFEGPGDLFSGDTATRISDALTRHLGVACITDEQAADFAELEDGKGLFSIIIGEFWVPEEGEPLYVDWPRYREFIPVFTFDYLEKALVKGALKHAILNRLRYLQDELMIEDDAKHDYQ
jgi:hypothetical protein